MRPPAPSSCILDTYSGGAWPVSRSGPARLRAAAGPGREARPGGEDPMLLPDTAGALRLAGPFERLAARALDDQPLTRPEALAVLESSDAELPALLWAAFAVRARHWANDVKLCVLQNARSGLCPEDCGYCSQSAVATSSISRYRLLPVEELLAAARRAEAGGARRYCM